MAFVQESAPPTSPVVRVEYAESTPLANGWTAQELLLSCRHRMAGITKDPLIPGHRVRCPECK